MAETTQVLEREEAKARLGSSAKLIRTVKKATRRKFSAEDKIRIVLEGFRKEIPITEFSRRGNIADGVYYSWLKDFIEAGNARLKGDSLCSANEQEVKQLRDAMSV